MLVLVIVRSLLYVSAMQLSLTGLPSLEPRSPELTPTETGAYDPEHYGSILEPQQVLALIQKAREEGSLPHPVFEGHAEPGSVVVVDHAHCG